MVLLKSILKLMRRNQNNSKHQWILAAGNDKNGNPMTIHYRSDIPEGVDIREYPHLLVVSWKYQPENENGMPSDSDWERMVFLENLLELVETKRAAFMMVSVTCNGTKEWQWYSRDYEEFIENLNSSLSNHEPFPIKISQEEDPEWSEYFGIKSKAN
jgi:hypothetical protein